MNLFERGTVVCSGLVSLLVLQSTPAQAAFPGANGKIAFDSLRDGNQEIYVMDADGGNQTRLTMASFADETPSWSPDGSKIAFKDGLGEIIVMNADGTGMTNISSNPATFDGEPAWSPDGSKIAFRSDRTGNPEVFVINSDGSGVAVNLTNNSARDDQPAWSPDGNFIAFRTDRDVNTEIYVMTSTGGSPTNLTNSLGLDCCPDWSPDGAMIAFQSTRTGTGQVFLMTADGSGQTNISDGTGFDSFPAWSPDGSKIVFQSSRSGGGDIYVMDSDGSSPTRLTTAAAADANPDWQATAPSPDSSTVPKFIDLVGQSGDAIPVADPDGEFVVVVRNASGDPMPGVLVSIDFGGCPDLAPAAEQPFPGMVTSCGPPPVVAALTNGDGEATFNVVGSVVDRTVAPYGYDCATVYANGIPIGSATVVGRDQDGIGGLDSHDVYLALCDVWDPLIIVPTVPYWGRSDVHRASWPYVLNALDVAGLWQQRVEDKSAKTGVRCDGLPISKPVITPATGGLNVAWSACAEGGGLDLMTFDCTSTTVLELNFSAVLPDGGFTFTSFEAMIDVIGDAGMPLPDWWRLDQTGCRAEYFFVERFPGGVCPAPILPLSTPGNLLAGMSYDGSPENLGTIRVAGILDSATRSLPGGGNVALFKLSVGAMPSPCSGCEEEIAIVFRSLKFTQGGLCTTLPGQAGADILITRPDLSNVAYFQGIPTGVVTVPQPGVEDALESVVGYPNPFDRRAGVRFTLARAAEVDVNVFDLAGRKVRRLHSGKLSGGAHVLTWDGLDASGVRVQSGTYFVKVEAEDRVLSSKIVRIR